MLLRRSPAPLLVSFLALVLVGCGGSSSNVPPSPTTPTAPTTPTTPAISAPVISSLDPSSRYAGGGAFTLTVSGSGFASDAVVQWNGAQRSTVVVGSSQLTASISAQDVASAGLAQVTVTSAGRTSSTANFTIATAPNPTPSIASLSPSTVVADGKPFTLTVNGSGFVAGSTVAWNGSARATTVVNASQLTASISAADIASAGSASVTVSSPAPGGGTSAAAAFTVSPAPPVLISLSPASASAGDPAFTLTVNGSGFVNGAVVAWNGSARPTTLVSATQLTAAIPASDVATAGTAAVDVSQGGLRSTNQLSFSIQVAKPVISAISPASVSAGGPAFTLSVTGSAFAVDATLLWNGSPRATTVTSTTQLTAAIPASDIVSAGSAAIDVVQSNIHAAAAVPLTIRRVVTAPQITSFSPAGVFAGAGAFSLQVNGTGFTSGSFVSWNGTRLTTTFVSTTQLTAAVTADQDASAGAASILINNASDEGGVSSSASFPVNAAPAGKIVQLVSRSYLDGSPSQSVWDRTSVSASGRYVGYMSYAADLVPGDTNGEKDGFVTDTCVGAANTCTPSTQRVSVDANGAQYLYGGVSALVLMSGDGRYALYDRNNDIGTEIRDTCAGVSGCTPTTRVIYSNPTVNPPYDGIFCCSRYSADGRYVLSGRVVQKADGTVGGALYVLDTCIGAVPACTPFSQRVALGTTSTPPDQAFQEDISSGGRYILFRATGKFIDPALSTTMHVFLQDTCIAAPAGCTASYSMIDVRSDGSESDGNSPNDAAADAESSFSADGRYVVFASTDQHLLANRTIANGSEVYLRDTCIGAAAGCTPSTILVSEDETAPGLRAYKGSRAVSEHGRYVTYLRVPVSGGRTSIRVRDTCVGAPAGCIPSTTTPSSDPDGVNPGSSATSYLFPSISADGHYVTFTGSSSPISRIPQVFLGSTGY